MSDFFEKNKKGLSKNFTRSFGYRVYTIGSWSRPGFVELHLQKIEGGKHFVAKPVEIVWEPREPFTVDRKPFLEFDCSEDQEQHGTSILEALQDLFTPAEKKARPFVEGELDATKKHLEDMRKLALGSKFEKAENA